MSQIPAKLDHASIEQKWYDHWESSGYFKSKPDDRDPFTILIPPPNVTGVLHMGHMLNNTIQDVLIRRARLKGMNACWVPGMDHASIATEAKVVRMLREKGIKKSDLTREQFLDHAWAWKEEYGGIILKQLRRLGASCDWDRTAFTMDETRSEAVLQAFVDLYKKDLLYRKLRMVNWDPQAQTVLSNEEVIYKNENANLYHVAYQVEGSDEKIVIATTRPETILGDTAIAVHPDDPRYAHLKGKRAIVPMVDRSVPIIFDDYVDMEFGTGALKITPAHDPNDYEIGERHGLETIDILTAQGAISEEGQMFVGMDRFDARVEAIKFLKGTDALVQIEQISHNVGRSERTDSVVEPRLSLQWYVDMKKLAGPALEAVVSDEVEFFPKKQKNIYSHWMNNIRDWCISRQLWWGHRIPAWYYKDEVAVAMDAQSALEDLRNRFPDENIDLQDLRQDEDVLDTWFSSWLWPISVFDGFKDRTELDYYYPTSVLVTGWDIIFLWVARMIMAGYEWEDMRPFDKVYFTGMVRDKQRRKMSKSLGNSPDALKLIDQYGADGVRFGMLSCSPAGGDLLFDEKLCVQGSKFCIKMWNALRLITSWEGTEAPAQDDQTLALTLIESKLNELIQDLDKNYEQFRLSESLIQLYTFVWSDFCSWFLEMMKPENGQLNKDVLDQVKEIYKQICVVLHPYMPFITEEMFDILSEGKKEVDCMMSAYPVSSEVSKDHLKLWDIVQKMVTALRDASSKHGVERDAKPEVWLEQTPVTEKWIGTSGFQAMISKLADVGSLVLTTEQHSDKPSFICDTEKVYLNVEMELDKEAELARLEEELKYAEGFLASVMKKLSNSRFVDNAPEAVVAKEKQKQADGEERVRILKASIENLK